MGSCFSGYHNDPFLVRFSLLYFYVIYFISRSILMLPVILMLLVKRHPIYSTDSIENTIWILGSSSARSFNWFQQNAMKANPNKCHLFLSINQNKWANINSNASHNSSSNKLLEPPLVQIWSLIFMKIIYVKKLVRNYMLLQELRLSWM